MLRMLFFLFTLLFLSHYFTSHLTSATCAPGWSEFTGKCYKLVKGSYNHPQAQAHCTALGGTLSSTHNEKENAFVRGLLDEEMKKTGAGGVYHIGMMFSRTYSNASGPVSSAVWMDGTPVDFGNPAVGGFEPGTSPWSDGKAFGRPAEPSGDGLDGKAPELCVAMIQSADVNGDWSDVSCKSLANMVCKKKSI
ncbi:lectin c-type domain-containing protein [Ditylenchus destructor]|uniref:Lectin c-type domain-containing protein n=1 Tax=Ditylenchus destructor TaxID=166010 RepID=A0AAD4MLB3_9BILA|nr:lectin c-type domain-containing protein [Ditylenchus destructor]